MNREHERAFNWQAERLDVPRERRRVGNLKRGWCSDCSAHTIRARNLDLRHFAAFVLGTSVAAPSDAAHVHAALVVLGLLRNSSAYAEGVVLKFVETREGKAASLIRCVSTLRSWARYLHAKREVPGSLDAMPTPKAADLRMRSSSRLADMACEGVDPHRLSPAAKTRTQRFIAARSEALLDLLAHSTLNRQQLLNLYWRAVEFAEDPDFHKGLMPLPTPVRVQVPARDGRLLWRDLGHYATGTLKSWSRVFASRFGRTLPELPVFAGLRGQPLSQARFYELTNPDRTG